MNDDGRSDGIEVLADSVRGAVVYENKPVRKVGVLENGFDAFTAIAQLIKSGDYDGNA
jgi:hypothetical protein